MPDKPDAAEAAAGRRIYTQNCSRCHGINMVSPGGAFFDLRQYPLEEKERFFRSVNEGVRAMPAWKDGLKPEEINKVWAYVVSHEVK
jgi:mono/diheme cytochrome c family protein